MESGAPPRGLQVSLQAALVLNTLFWVAFTGITYAGLGSRATDADTALAGATFSVGILLGGLAVLMFKQRRWHLWVILAYSSCGTLTVFASWAVTPRSSMNCASLAVLAVMLSMVILSLLGIRELSLRSSGSATRD